MSPGKLERRGERGKRERRGALLNLEMSSKHCGRADKEKAPQEEGKEETVLVIMALGVVNILSLRVSDVRGKLK